VATVDICNRALGEIGTRSTIASLTEQSNEALACKTHFEPLVKRLLRMANWNFARRTTLLTLLKAMPGTPENPTVGNGLWTSAHPAPPWLYAYAYPSDCIRVQQVLPQASTTGGVTTPIFPVGLGGATPYGYREGSSARFKVALDLDSNNNEIKVIITNQRQAIVNYTKTIVNTDMFDDSFESALVAALGAKLAISLAGDKQLSLMKYQEADALIKMARADDANETVEMLSHVPSWISARGYSGAAHSESGEGYFYEPYASYFSG
jgi:hypothetical protein